MRLRGGWDHERLLCNSAGRSSADILYALMQPFIYLFIRNFGSVDGTMIICPFIIKKQ